MTKRAFNPTDSPVVIDSQGRVLGGGEWADVDDRAKPVTDAIARGSLLYPDSESPSTPEPAAADHPKE